MKKLKNYMKIGILLVGFSLALTNCEKKELTFPKNALLNEKEQIIVEQIKETDEFAVLSQALLRVKYYIKKTGLSYNELKEFALDKEKSKLYVKTIDNAGVKKGSLIYDVRLFLQLSLSIQESYFTEEVNCSSKRVITHVLGDLVFKRSKDIIKYELEALKNQTGKYAKNGKKRSEAICTRDEDCTNVQICCFDMNILKRICKTANLVYTQVRDGQWILSKQCPQEIIFLDEVVINANPPSNNDWTWNDDDWMNPKDNLNEEPKWPYHDTNQDNQWNVHISSQNVNFNKFYIENITNYINNLSNPITGNPIELYLIAKYKSSITLDLSVYSISSNEIQVGEYFLKPHYGADKKLVFYTAYRTGNNENTSMGIEYIIKANALTDFQNNIDLYTSYANLFYIGGVPSQGQIAMASGDYIAGLKNMWAEALKNPNYYIYLGNVFVFSATNVNAVNSSTRTYSTSKINYSNITKTGSRYPNYVINNRSFNQYKNLIQQKYGVSWSNTSSPNVQVLIKGNVKYSARSFATDWSFGYTIEYYRNGVLIGKFRLYN